MSTNDERMAILDMVDRGVITAEEGARLIQALEGEPASDQLPADASFAYAETAPTHFGPSQAGPEEPEVLDAPTDPRSEEFNRQIERWRRWWTIPLWVGVGITLTGGLLMLWAYNTSGLSFWFGCAWLPFLLGVAVIALAVNSRTSRWLHLRVHQRPGERPQTIAFSIPLPLNLAAWFVRNFGRFIPQLDRPGLDQMILGLGERTGPQAPFYIEVNEGESGERVEIYIG